MTRRPELLDRQAVWRGRVTVDRLQVRLAGGAQVAREVVSRGDAAAVLPYDAARRCALLVRLFRAPAWDAANQPELEEACAGKLDAGEAPEAAMRREAMEEMGLSVGELEPVARVWPSPAILTERIWLYLAPYSPADRVGPGGGAPDEHEGITVVERPLAALAALADAGRLEDAKLLILVQALRLRRPELFGP
jgi:nudix-type nucleoside diphosphatase (YffH/AdpP family)